MNRALVAMLRKINIHKRLIVTFSLTILIPTLIIAWSNYFSFISHIEGKAIRNLEFVTNISGQLFQNELNRYENMTLQMNKDEELFAYLNILSSDMSSEASTAIGNLLFDYAKDFTYISNLQIVTDTAQYSQVNEMGYQRGAFIEELDGFLAHERMNEVATAKGYPVWFDTTDETHVYFTQRNTSVTIAEYLTLMRAMIDPVSKEQIATIVVTVDIAFIKNAMNFNSIISEGNILFVSEKGPLASLNENLDAPRITDFKSVMNRIQEADEAGDGLIQDDRTIIFFNKLPQTEYYIIQVVDRYDLTKEALQLRNRNIVVTLLCIMLAMIFAYSVTKSISEPIDQLAMTMKETEHKQLPSIYETSGKDEITELGSHYNTMLKEIADLIDELYVTEIKKNDARLNALQMQINPHFIYNTMDFMRWEAMDLTEGENNLSKMINDFSKLLRLSIKRGRDIVSVEEELLHIEVYLKVANYRHDKPIDLSVDNAVGAFEMPKLTLQPFIENAVIHGFEENESDKQLLVKVAQRGSDLEISIRDNGKGISEEELIRLNNRLLTNDVGNESIGILNVNQRIKLYYGDTYGIRLQSDSHRGTTAVLRIPYMKWRQMDV